MLVDDSSTFRNFLRNVLSEESDLEIVAQASNGRLALTRLDFYRPDIIILDQEMPEMDGIETLEILRKEHSKIGVIMLSSRSVIGANLTVKALHMGALDFITKPDRETDGDPVAYIKKNLMPRIREFHSATGMTRPHLPAVRISLNRNVPAGYFNICGIGVSTGGPVALRAVFQQLPRNLEGSIVVVQHMPALFTEQLAQSLNEISGMHVVEASNGVRLENGIAYIAPGGRHLSVEKDEKGLYLRVFDAEPELNCRPSVNIFFRSLARSAGDRAAGIIMTGMGNDGYLGLKEMKAAGAYLIAQNRESCLVYGMPALPISEGIVDEILDLSEIAQRIRFLLGG